MWKTGLHLFVFYREVISFMWVKDGAQRNYRLWRKNRQIPTLNIVRSAVAAKQKTFFALSRRQRQARLHQKQISKCLWCASTDHSILNCTNSWVGGFTFTNLIANEWLYLKYLQSPHTIWYVERERTRERERERENERERERERERTKERTRERSEKKIKSFFLFV